MTLQYLGTGAAEGIPCIFCSCDSCRKARVLGGKEIRTRSQALIDGTLLIDFPCDTFYHSVKYGVDFSRINHCLITHIHGDHFSIGDFAYLHPNYTTVISENYEGFHLYGSIDLEEKIEALIQRTSGRIQYHCIQPFEPFAIQNMNITALKARHGTKNPYIYMIEKEGKTILYAHDTDIFPEETWQYLKKVFDTKKSKLNLVSLDCTAGAHEELDYHGHMCLGRTIKCRQKMLDMEIANSDTVFILNHFSHNGSHVNYKEFIEIAGAVGFQVSYDGLTVDA